jgi:hypothetical protein
MSAQHKRRLPNGAARSFDDKAAYWVTNDRRIMDVVDMSTAHIRNAVAKIKRLTGWRKEMLPRLEYELELRALGDEPTQEQLTALRVKYTLLK